MKKIMFILLIMTLIFTGCGKQSQPKDEKPVIKEEQEQEKQQEDEQEEEQAEVQMQEPITVWSISNVNFRNEPGTNGSVIKVISKGTEIQKISEKDGWAYVKISEENGYISAEYLSDTKPEEEPVSVPKVAWIPGQKRNPNKIVVVIDPGHQLRGDSTKEPNGPGSSVMKARVTSGTTGVATRVPEYIMNLDISLKLQAELQNRGYTVYMTRSIHEVNISNMERAKYAETVGADIAVRIHGNGSTNQNIQGAETYVPSSANPYVSHLANASNVLGKYIVDEYCKATGFKNRGVFTSDTMTGMNWSTVPVTILEVGYMSNAEEDQKMQDATIQNNMVQGIANGIDKYFGY